MSSTLTEAPPVQDTTDDPDDGGGGASAAPSGELFDKSDYDREDLQLPKIDGEGVDLLMVTFTGAVKLDRSDPADCELVRQMRLGQDITLMVEGRPTAKQFKAKVDNEGGVATLTLLVPLAVHTLYRPVSDDQAEAA